MTNNNWLHNMACPNCESEGPFYIDAMVTVTMTDDGPVDFDTDNADFSPEHSCICQACGIDGRVSDFTFKGTNNALS